MTDKQIIIDGVDIKDCKRRIGKDNFCRYYKRPCSENNYNCIWKKYLRKEQECQQAMDNYVQLDLQRVKEYNELVDLYKAKEQECEKLKKECEIWKSQVLTLDDEMITVQITQQQFEEYNQLKVENEELKRQHQGNKGLITATGKMNYQLIQEYDKLKAENEELRNFHINLVGVKECDIGELLKLKQALAEIKEIAENEIDSKEFMVIQYMLNGNIDNKNKVLKQILQKISECEVKNEYNTKDIRHINENNQEYIAEGNRMTKNE